MKTPEQLRKIDAAYRLSMAQDLLFAMHGGDPGEAECRVTIQECLSILHTHEETEE